MKCQMFKCEKKATTWFRGRDALREMAICDQCAEQMPSGMREGARIELRPLTKRVEKLLVELAEYVPTQQVIG